MTPAPAGCSCRRDLELRYGATLQAECLGCGYSAAVPTVVGRTQISLSLRVPIAMRRGWPRRRCSRGDAWLPAPGDSAGGGGGVGWIGQAWVAITATGRRASMRPSRPSTYPRHRRHAVRRAPVSASLSRPPAFPATPHPATATAAAATWCRLLSGRKTSRSFLAAVTASRVSPAPTRVAAHILGHADVTDSVPEPSHPIARDVAATLAVRRGPG